MSRTDVDVADITKDNAHEVRCCKECSGLDMCMPENFMGCGRFVRYIMTQARRNHKLYRLHGDKIIIEIKRDSNEINE